jgi:hypothetical protein
VFHRVEVKRLKPLIEVLPSENSHNFHGFFPDSKIDTFRTTNTPSISWFDMVDWLKGIRVFGNEIKIVKKGIKIGVCLIYSEPLNAVLMNPNQIIPCFFT